MKHVVDNKPTGPLRNRLNLVFSEISLKVWKPWFKKLHNVFLKQRHHFIWHLKLKPTPLVTWHHPITKFLWRIRISILRHKNTHVESFKDFINTVVITDSMGIHLQGFVVQNTTSCDGQKILRSVTVHYILVLVFSIYIWLKIV